MDDIELRFSESARRRLNPKTRRYLQTIENALAEREGLDLCLFLISCIVRTMRSKPDVAAVAVDELSVLLAASREDSQIRKLIVEFFPTLRTWIPRKKMVTELRVCAVCSLVEMGVMPPARAKELLAEQLQEQARLEYSAYTLCRLLVLFAENRKQKLINQVEARLKELQPEPLLQVLLRLYPCGRLPIEWRVRGVRAWSAYRHHATHDVLKRLSTAALVQLLQIRREDSGSMGEVAAVRELLQRRDRHFYSYNDALALSAYSISRNEALQELVSSELALHPPTARESPLLLAECAKHGVIPMCYLATTLKPLLDKQGELHPFERLQILTALATLGTVDPVFVEQVFDEMMPSFRLALPYMLFVFPDAVWAFSICDLLLQTDYTRQIFAAMHDLLEVGYQDFDDRERMRIGRAALSVNYFLPSNFRNSIRRIMHTIEQNPPRPNISEQNFVEQLRRALPGAKVRLGGFKGTHHLDVSVCWNDKCYDAELDGRFHEVYDFLGRKIGRRGSDLIRDQLVEREGVHVVRFTHDELSAPDADELIRNRFADKN